MPELSTDADEVLVYDPCQGYRDEIAALEKELLTAEREKDQLRDSAQNAYWASSPMRSDADIPLFDYVDDLQRKIADAKIRLDECEKTFRRKEDDGGEGTNPTGRRNALLVGAGVVAVAAVAVTGIVLSRAGSPSPGTPSAAASSKPTTPFPTSFSISGGVLLKTGQNECKLSGDVQAAFTITIDANGKATYTSTNTNNGVALTFPSAPLTIESSTQASFRSSTKLTIAGVAYPVTDTARITLVDGTAGGKKSLAFDRQLDGTNPSCRNLYAGSYLGGG